MLFLLALAVGVLGGILAHAAVAGYGTLARVAAAVAGFIAGYWLTHVIVANIN